ncbi:bifunctional DNA primase/polymerase [Mycobacteroides abscessus]|uniref:Bifunctional DNA primase/polymerase domain protein n=1 Tax=Mycobacteroides abscessus subsp. massiliense TaxID=1962118 RepID=A0A1T8NVT9_9MYCO|nr:bifunctional DNA primase/polymerase [Mycobacteroides abscessus]SKM23337.1 bifunctional DNA primase/polymerase domain protein [Mycobacteroides abscessus subsp. massiliense]SKT04344.1 bifunctional DNA primase/polymerase domain protein [Mycobacteroides abscessus subsp. massiliense]SKT64878.1 bifunctional DNA primase/polymerase domain protein [Mycobacteroides abscessus subsp. massiliense]SKX21441.1 bifunctional DNA primase/polymerase domain protein [Mycobacteroides abscessus subsp. massiliense]
MTVTNNTPGRGVDLRGAALRYTEMGWRVFPCKPKSKQPATAHGFKDATTSRGQVESWWDSKPQYNIGVCPPDDVVVFDLDHSTVVEGFENEFGPLPQTLTARTRRGQHLFFRVPAGVRVPTTGEFNRAAVDIKTGASGYLIAAPSAHPSGGRYQWVDEDAPIADLPDSLLLRFREVTAVKAAPKPAAQPVRTSDVVPYYKAALEAEMVAMATTAEGGRNRQLNTSAFNLGQLVPHGLTEDEVTDALTAAARSTTGEPMTDGEIERTIRSGLEAGMRDPRRPDDAAKGSSTAASSTPVVTGKPDADKGAGNAVMARRLVVTRGSQVQMQVIKWWEPDWIPLGEVTLLAGREGLGKSTIACGWAARETRAGNNIGYLHSEDSRAHTVAPRLAAAGADMDKVCFFDVQTPTANGSNSTATLSLPADLSLLEKAVIEHNITLLVFDAVKSFKDSSLGQHDDDVRALLEPLGQMAARLNVVVIGLVHFGKRESSDTGKLILGSIAWSQVVRSVLAVAEDKEQDRLIVTNTKANLSPRTRSAGVRIVSKTVHTEGGDSEVGVAEWLGDTNDDARDFLNQPEPVKSDDELDTHDYTPDLKASWLARYLAAAAKAGERVRPNDVIAYGRDKGHSRASVYRLFPKLVNAGMAESVDGEGFPRIVYWRWIDETTGPVHGEGETTETTGADLRKQGETPAVTRPEDETTGKTAPGQAIVCTDSAVVSVVSPNPTHTPPDETAGALTADSPGQTDRVARALANAQAKKQAVA